jgi:hypothetical protein
MQILLKLTEVSNNGLKLVAPLGIKGTDVCPLKYEIRETAYDKKNQEVDERNEPNYRMQPIADKSCSG